MSIGKIAKYHAARLLKKIAALGLLKKSTGSKHAKFSRMPELPEDIDQSEGLSVADKELGTNAKLFREHFAIRPRPAPNRIATKVPIPIWRPGYMATPGSPIKYDPFLAETFAGKPMPSMSDIRREKEEEKMRRFSASIDRLLESFNQARKELLLEEADRYIQQKERERLLEKEKKEKERREFLNRFI